MEFALMLARGQLFVSLGLATVVLYFQVRAYVRHGKSFLAALASSTVFAMLATTIALAPYFVQLTQEQSLSLYTIAVPVGVLATLLATWGSVRLFLAFDAK